MREKGQSFNFYPLENSGYLGEIRDEQGSVDYATLQDNLVGIIRWAKEHGFNLSESNRKN